MPTFIVGALNAILIYCVIYLFIYFGSFSPPQFLHLKISTHKKLFYLHSQIHEESVIFNHWGKS